ncbi:MAG: hypothetical protein KatS3mg111_1540 [Pirellulaceae bacterium]|nr:MAG: hypothetical protein KatS3mg111_1540 [Pirellulaceae bacterium]
MLVRGAKTLTDFPSPLVDATFHLKRWSVKGYGGKGERLWKIDRKRIGVQLALIVKLCATAITVADCRPKLLLQKRLHAPQAFCSEHPILPNGTFPHGQIQGRNVLPPEERRAQGWLIRYLARQT